MIMYSECEQKKHHVSISVCLANTFTKYTSIFILVINIHFIFYFQLFPDLLKWLFDSDFQCECMNVT